MILIGNTFPLSLIRRAANITPASLEELRRLASTEGFLSFWGHGNTRKAAIDILGFDPAPPHERPALVLSPDNLPSFDGHVFQDVWVLSPNYVSGFRPDPGTEVAADQITSWQVLKIHFC